MDADRNLLFGVLSLQSDLIDSRQFIEACTLWTASKATPLADLLIARGWILPIDRDHVDYLLDRKLQKRGADVGSSLEGVPDDVKRSLAALGDADIQRSLTGSPAPAGPPPTETVDYATEPDERYTLTHLHASGGIGRVWFVRDASLGRDVALKELRPERADDAVHWARFLKEAQITGRLEHPGIVPVYDLSRWPDTRRPFYTMRFVRGRTLSEATRAYHDRRRAGRADSLELLSLLNAFVMVCNTVAYAHSRGIIHRDLKGQNVVLGDFGEVVVLDWGLAKLVDQPDGEGRASSTLLGEDDSCAADLTLAGQALGTPPYMAPEQAAGRLDQIDRRTDVYGLGAILYEILAGRPPFDGPELREILRRVREEEPVPPRQVCAESPPALEAVCLRALAKHPADRYASASELALEVQGWQELQRRLAEDALRQSEALYHSLVEMLPLQVWRKDLEGRFTFANKGFCDATGRCLGELLGVADLDLFPAELAAKYQRDDVWVIANGKTLEGVEEHQTAQGERLHVHVVKTPIYDKNGAIVGTQGIFWDVSDRKRLQEDLDRTSAELAAAK